MALPVPACPCPGLGTLGLCTEICTGIFRGDFAQELALLGPLCHTPVPGGVQWHQRHTGRGFSSLGSQGTAFVKPACAPVLLKKPNSRAQVFLPRASIRKNAWKKGDQIQGNFWGTGFASSITSAGDAGISHRAELIFSVPAAAATPALSSPAPPSQDECFGRLLVPNQWTL